MHYNHLSNALQSSFECITIIFRMHYNHLSNALQSSFECIAIIFRSSEKNDCFCSFDEPETSKFKRRGFITKIKFAFFQFRMVRKCFHSFVTRYLKNVVNINNFFFILLQIVIEDVKKLHRIFNIIFGNIIVTMVT